MSHPQEHNVVATSASGPLAPSYRVRISVPSASLKPYGVSISHRPLFSSGEAIVWNRAGPVTRIRLLAEAHVRQRHVLERSSADVAVVSRQVDLVPALVLERAAARDRRLVYDVDDAIWLSGRRDAGGHPLARLKAARRKAIWLARRASVVVAGNAILAEWFERYADNVVVVPSLVEPADIALRQHQEADELVVGWIGSSTTAPYLADATDAISAAARALPTKRLRLLVVGGRALAIPGVTTEAMPWSVEHERDALARMDVGIMPLPDNPWTRGKCAYKSLQYMAAGVPVVADDVGITGHVLGAGSAGLIATGKTAWTDALVDLLSDVTHRRTVGLNGRRRVEAEFSPSRWSATLAEAYGVET
jgi:glycosyltransferase involved in cell wall biosynthesis